MSPSNLTKPDRTKPLSGEMKSWLLTEHNHYPSAQGIEVLGGITQGKWALAVIREGNGEKKMELYHKEPVSDFPGSGGWYARVSGEPTLAMYRQFQAPNDADFTAPWPDMAFVRLLRETVQ